MVHQFHDPRKHIIAHEVIILGCSLPGVVAAYKLKQRFGDTLDVLLIDLAKPLQSSPPAAVGFFLKKEHKKTENKASDTSGSSIKQFLLKCARELKVPIPDAIIEPQKNPSTLNKLFQHIDGNSVPCETNFHDFEYLGWLEKFELNQFQTLLDENLKILFQTGKVDTSVKAKKLLLKWDRTTMEKYICECLMFRTSRGIMRVTVNLVCGAPADQVSVLFYLYQCYRNDSTKNSLDGENIRVREKLLGYCRHKIAAKLQQGVEEITQKNKWITQIRAFSEKQVILETRSGDTNFVCNLLAMALSPEDMQTILIQSDLIIPQQTEAVQAMVQGQTKKFEIAYEDNFWREFGYSGDIVSIKGPIIWAIERPKLSTSGSESYASLIGYLKIENGNGSSKDAVIEQLVSLFGEEAQYPVSYNEVSISDIFVPKCGDFVVLAEMTESPTRLLDWAPLDVYADGDLAGSLEAGHKTYLNLLRFVRPQAITYEDARLGERPTVLPDDPVTRWKASVNFMRGIYYAVICTMLIGAYKLVRRHWK